MAAQFGIRVGATTTCVAVFKDGKVDVLANDAGDRVTPAVISYNDGELSVGLRSNRNPSNVITNPKGLLGYSDLESDAVKDIIHRCPCKIGRHSNDELVYELTDSENKTIKKVGVQYALQLLFEQLMKTATSHSGVQGDQYAVLTVPFYFNDDQKERMKNAATAAGFKILQLIHEPSAALLAYQIGQDVEAEFKDQNVLVFRVGGASSDVAVVNVCNGFYRILTKIHKADLGGDKITELLAQNLAEEFKRHYKIDVQSKQRSMYKLRQAAEVCKHVLSTLTTTNCSVDSLHDGMDFTCPVSRARLETLLKCLIPKFLEALDEALISCNLKVGNIDKVVFCGGTCKIPRLQQILSDYFPNAEILNQFLPDEVLAIGAANQAASLRGLGNVSSNGEECIIPTITRALFYKVVENGGQNVIFNVGTPTPAFREINLPLSMIGGNQLCLEIFEMDEKSSNVEYSLAKITMDDLTHDSKIRASFRATSENTLEIMLKEQTTARVKTLTIE